MDRINNLKSQKGFIMAGMLVTLLAIVFFVWVLVAGTPNERIERTCKPTVWAGKVVIATTDLINTDYSPKVTHFVEQANYSCRYIVWKTFYAEEWMKERAKQEAGKKE